MLKVRAAFIGGLLLGVTIAVAAQGAGVPVEAVARALKFTSSVVDDVPMSGEAAPPTMPSSSVSMPPLVIDAGAADGSH